MEHVDSLCLMMQEYDRLDEEHSQRFQSLPHKLKLPGADRDKEERKRGMPELQRQTKKVYALQSAIQGVIAQTYPAPRGLRQRNSIGQ